MKIKFTVLFVIVLMLVAMPVGAQPPHACGTITSLSVIFDRVDAGGYAPRMKEGSQAQFDCIAARDPYFNSQRFDRSDKALNYWFGLFGQELGVTLLPLPTR